MRWANQRKHLWLCYIISQLKKSNFLIEQRHFLNESFEKPIDFNYQISCLFFCDHWESFFENAVVNHMTQDYKSNQLKKILILVNIIKTCQERKILSTYILNGYSSSEGAARRDKLPRNFGRSFSEGSCASPRKQAKSAAWTDVTPHDSSILYSALKRLNHFL